MEKYLFSAVCFKIIFAYLLIPYLVLELNFSFSDAYDAYYQAKLEHYEQFAPEHTY